MRTSHLECETSQDGRLVRSILHFQGLHADGAMLWPSFGWPANDKMARAHRGCLEAGKQLAKSHRGIGGTRPGHSSTATSLLGESSHSGSASVWGSTAGFKVCSRQSKGT